MNDETDNWVKKLNALAREMDEIAGSTHPSMVSAYTAELRKKYHALALNGNKNDKIQSHKE